MAKAKKAPGIRVQCDTDSRSFTIQVKAGDTVTSEEQFYLADLPAEILQQLEVKAAPTILGQRTSDVKADPLAKLAAMKEVWAMWETGQYERDRKAGPRLVPAVIEAIVARKGCTTSEAQAAYNAFSDEVKEKLRDTLKADIEAIEKARSEAEPVDLTDLI